MQQEESVQSKPESTLHSHREREIFADIVVVVVVVIFLLSSWERVFLHFSISV